MKIDTTNLVQLKTLNTRELKTKMNHIFDILDIKNPTDKQKYDLMSYLHQIS